MNAQFYMDNYAIIVLLISSILFFIISELYLLIKKVDIFNLMVDEKNTIDNFAEFGIVNGIYLMFSLVLGFVFVVILGFIIQIPLLLETIKPHLTTYIKVAIIITLALIIKYGLYRIFMRGNKND